MTRGRLDALGLAGLVLLAVVLQVSVLSQVAVRGVVPDLVLVLVVALGLVRGPRSGAIAGFWAGLVLDVAPPADHVAGAWALVLLGVGLLAGRAAGRPRSPVGVGGGPVRPVLLTAGLSLGAHVVFALLVVLTGGDPVLGSGSGLGTLAQIVALAVLMDVIAAALLLGPLRRMLGAMPGRRDHEEDLGRLTGHGSSVEAADPDAVVVRATDQRTGQMVGLTRGETWHRS